MKCIVCDKNELHAGLDGIDDNYELYVSCFPDPDERETKQKLKLLFVRVSGWNYAQLFDDSGALKGVCQFVQLGRSAFFEHIYVAPEVRLLGYGTELLRTVEKFLAERGVEFVFAEMNDDRLMTAEEIAADVPHPLERYKFWVKMGYQMVNAPYRQPPLVDFIPTAAELELLADDDELEESSGESEEPATVDYLSVIVKPLKGGDTVPALVYLDALSDYFGTFLPTGQDPRQDPCYLEAEALLSGHLHLDLMPLGTARTLVQTR